MKLSIPYFRQPTDTTCGPACTEMVLAYYNKKKPIKVIEKEEKTNKRGTRHDLLVKDIRKAGLTAVPVPRASQTKLRNALNGGYPVIVNYVEPKTNEGHYAVVEGFNKKGIFLADPFIGNKFFIANKEFNKRWHNEENTSKKWMLIVKPRKLVKKKT